MTRPTSTSARVGRQPSRRMMLGQNFLHNRRLVSQLVESSTITTSDVVIEIGPGKGIITDALADRCRHVLAIEKDPHHARIMQERSCNRENVTVFAADILEFPLPASPYKVFANIPFNLTAAIVGRLTSGIAPPDDAWLVMQREAAERFLGHPVATLQSAKLMPWFSLDIVHRFQKQDFAPVPQVESVLMRIEHRANPLVSLQDRPRFESLVTALFAAWKPSVETALATIMRPDEVKALRKPLGRHGISLTNRPSMFPVDGWIALFNEIDRQHHPRIWDICREAAAKVARQQEAIQKRTQTPVRPKRRM